MEVIFISLSCLAPSPFWGTRCTQLAGKELGKNNLEHKRKCLGVFLGLINKYTSNAVEEGRQLTTISGMFNPKVVVQVL